MQSHDGDHEKQGDHEAGAQQQPHEDASLEHDGSEPTPRVAASVPTGGATEHAVRVADTRGRSLGNFLLTHYTFALESDPIHNGSPKVSAPGLPKDKKYKQSFLGSPYGIKMQGTGKADDGQYIRYLGGGRYGYGVGGAAGAPEAWKTVAVDPSVIKLGSHLEIEAYRSKGTFTAKDTGGAIKGKHIDVFAGAVPIKQAYALGTKHSEVVLLDGSGGGAPQHDGSDHPGQQHDQNGGAHQGAQHAGTQTSPHHQGYTPAPSLADARSGKAVIKRGMEGASIKFVQEKVHAAADGLFGPHTEAAVKTFQREHHLAADGEVGPHTMAAIDGHAQPHGGGGGGGDTHHDVPAASGSDPVAIARRYVTSPPTPSIKLKGKLPHFTAAGGQTNDCADFVSSVLETAGRISGHHINVGEFERSLKAQGWKYVTKQHARAGDVWMNTSRGHTELVASDGASHLIGSNNDRPGHQVVTETSGHDGIFLHKEFAGGGSHDGAHKEAHHEQGGGDKGGGDKGGGDHKAPEHANGSGEAQIREEVLSKARSHTGAPYSWGAQGPSMFDCSGFSWYVLHTDTHLTTAGRTNAAGLSHAPYTTPTHEPEKGDLVFYASGGISHVTIALGSGSKTIGASGGGPSTHGNNPRAKVKETDWTKDSRSKTFGSIKTLIEHRLQGKK
ncbi:MAG TPA: NlpC/P60 family protein [Kofleriaceae bacterium]|nr:NlpC/P60 family protein [Kofleriaceae bacterium]